MNSLSRASIVTLPVLLAAAAMSPQAKAQSQLMCFNPTFNAWQPCSPTNPAWTINQAQHAYPVVPGTPFGPSKGLYTAGTSGGSACTLNLILASGDAAELWQNVQPGAVLPVVATNVVASGTTCTGILDLQ